MEYSSIALASILEIWMWSIKPGFRAKYPFLLRLKLCIVCRKDAFKHRTLMSVIPAFAMSGSAGPFLLAFRRYGVKNGANLHREVQDIRFPFFD